MKRFKGFKIAFAVALSLALCVGAYSAVGYTVSVNGSAPEAVTSGDMIPFDALDTILNNHFGADATLNAATGEITVSTGLNAKLSNRAPGKNENVTLSVSSSDLNGLPFTATLYYKSKQTPYAGTVGTPLEFKTGTATEGFQVLVYVTVKDGNGVTHECYTSFTPSGN